LKDQDPEHAAKTAAARARRSASPRVELDDIHGPTDAGPPANQDFERFWAAYPAHRRKREDAERAWYLVNGNRPKLEVLLAALERDKASEDWTRQKGRYIPSAERWLTDRQWERQADPEPF
jgi:hypothetical protein